MRRCCAASVAAGGNAVARLSVRCIRSCRPFCSGCPGAIRSGTIPSFSHQIDNCDSPPQPVDANGTPLSVRSRSGSP
ncbi:hypothetical protein D9M68_891150 [compost metagenome]